jgi:hypothetical protein
MTIAYETVKYYQGAPNKQAPGFGDPTHYDTRTSPISRAGSTQTILGQGGLLDAAGGILEDLQSGSVLGLIGATQKAGTAYNTFKNVNVGQALSNEVKAGAVAAANAAIPGAVRAISNTGSGWAFPTSGATKSTVVGTNPIAPDGTILPPI